MKSWVRAGIAACLLAAASIVSAQDKPKADKPKEEAARGELPKCVIMGDEIVDVTIKTQTDTGPVYFCCSECIDTYSKEAAKYADKVKAQQAAMKKLPRVQVSCPLDGSPIDKKSVLENDGKKTYFCGDKCKDKYAAEPAKYAAKLEGSYTYQTKCPVMGKGIDAATFVDLSTGQRVYLCCKMCDAKLTRESAKYVANLESQGVHVDVKKLNAGGTEKKDADKADEKKP